MSVSYDPVDEDGFEDEPLEPGAEEAPPDDYQPTREDEARALGWKPLEEFKGEPRLWRDYEEFLQHGYEDPRVLRENNQKLTQKTARLERQLGEARGEISDLKGQVGELLTLARRTEKSAYEQRREALSAKKREAVAEGDTSAYDQVEAELGRLDAERAAPAEPAPKPEPKFHPAILEFIDQNPWWSTDLDMQRAMVAHYDIVMRTRKDLDIEDQLALAKERLAGDFPDKLGEPPVPQRPAAPQRRPAAAAVSRPTGQSAPARPRREASGWDTIADPKEREEARVAFQSARRSDPGLTEDEYLTIYHDPKGADPLELRRKRKPA